MGREARVRKERTCKHCKGVLYTTNKGLVEHAPLCKRATAMGLILANHIVVK